MVMQLLSILKQQIYNSMLFRAKFFQLVVSDQLYAAPHFKHLGIAQPLIVVSSLVSHNTIYQLPRGYALKLTTIRLILNGPKEGARLVPDVALPASERKEPPPEVEKMHEDSWVRSALSILRYGKE